MSFITRNYETYTATFDVATWDIECETLWEKTLYIEYCSWAGYSEDDKGGIELSLNTIAKKLSKTMGDYTHRTIYNNLKIARKTLHEKGIIRIRDKCGFRNTKRYWLTDTEKSFKSKRFRKTYSKKRKELYDMI